MISAIAAILITLSIILLLVVCIQLGGPWYLIAYFGGIVVIGIYLGVRDLRR